MLHDKTAAMPSIEETKRQVKAGLEGQRRQQQQRHEVDHDAILASLWDEIDSHNGQHEELHTSRRHEEEHQQRQRGHADRKTSRFRFKDGAEPRKRRHRSRERGGEGEHRSRRKRRKEQHDRDQSNEAAHPFPREPANPDRNEYEDPNVAFQESLFDALADDEGAAYWESVYSQPIHVFPRPTVQNANGELEEMSDEQYATYVQTKMWEKKNPHIVLERQRAEKQRKEAEEEKARQREEFVRRKQRAAWERAQSEGARKFAGLDGDDKEYEYIFDFKDMERPTREDRTVEEQEYRTAWKEYLTAWDKLKLELLETDGTLSEEPIESKQTRRPPSKRIPWPVLQSKALTRPNMEDFMRHMLLEPGGPSKEQMLKSERVKWHPDKVQQRFRGEVDEGTMKMVTGVFQVVDALLEAERKR